MKKTILKVKKFLKVFGPGVITGAADDDPSGIATYNQTGAKFGYVNVLHFNPGIICASF